MARPARPEFGAPSAASHQLGLRERLGEVPNTRASTDSQAWLDRDLGGLDPLHDQNIKEKTEKGGKELFQTDADVGW